MHLIIQIKTFQNENSPIHWYDWLPPVFSYITTPLLAWGGSRLALGASLFVATQATTAAFSLRTFAKQSDE